MEIKDVRNLVERYIRIFRDAFEKKVEESSDVITKEFKDKIRIVVMDSSLHFLSDVIVNNFSKESFTRKELIDQHHTYVTQWMTKPYLTRTMFEFDEDGITHISQFEIIIKYDAIAFDLIHNLDKLDVFVELYKIDACHEVGHIKDNILSIEGVKWDDYTKNVLSIDDKAQDEYYKWERDIYESAGDHIDLETLKLIKKKYYMMPAEERADILGGVDREAALKLIYDNYEEHVDVNISVINKEKMS